MVLVEQEKASWRDDVVGQGYCLVVSLLEGCEPVLLPELLDGLCDEIVSGLMHACTLLIQASGILHVHINTTNTNLH